MLRETSDFFYKLMSGEDFDKDLIKKYYKEMGEDIKKEKARIGGNFAIAHVVLFKETRDLLRYVDAKHFINKESLTYIFVLGKYLVLIWFSSFLTCPKRTEEKGC